MKVALRACHAVRALPEMDGIAATQVIHRGSPLTRAMILSSIEDKTAVLAAVRAGAIGIVRKSAHGDVLRSLSALRRGEVQFSPADPKARLPHRV